MSADSWERQLMDQIGASSFPGTSGELNVSEVSVCTQFVSCFYLGAGRHLRPEENSKKEEKKFAPAQKSKNAGPINIRTK